MTQNNSKSKKIEKLPEENSTGAKVKIDLAKKDILRKYMDVKPQRKQDGAVMYDTPGDGND